MTVNGTFRLGILTFVAVVLAATSYCDDGVMSTSISAVSLEDGSYLIAGDATYALDDSVTGHYWYWRIGPDAETKQRGVVDVPDKHDILLGGLVGTGDGGFRILSRFDGILWEVAKDDAVTKLSRLKTEGGSLNFLRKHENGAYLAGGSTYQPREDGDLNVDGLLLWLDDEGDELARKVYERGKDEEIWALVPASDGGFMMVMSTGRTNKFGLGSVECLLMRCDAKGNVVKEVSLPGAQLNAKLARSNQEIVLLDSYMTEAAEGCAPSASLKLSAFSEDLTARWAKNVNDFQPMMVFTPEVAATEDGRFALVGSAKWPPTGDEAPPAELRVRVIRSGDSDDFNKLLQVGSDPGGDIFEFLCPEGALLADGPYLISAQLVHLMDMSDDGEVTSIVVQKLRLSDGGIVWEKRARLQKGGPPLE